MGEEEGGAGGGGGVQREAVEDDEGVPGRAQHLPSDYERVFLFPPRQLWTLLAGSWRSSALLVAVRWFSYRGIYRLFTGKETRAPPPLSPPPPRVSSRFVALRQI